MIATAHLVTAPSERLMQLYYAVALGGIQQIFTTEIAEGTENLSTHEEKSAAPSCMQSGSKMAVSFDPVSRFPDCQFSAFHRPAGAARRQAVSRLGSDTAAPTAQAACRATLSTPRLLDSSTSFRPPHASRLSPSRRLAPSFGVNDGPRAPGVARAGTRLFAGASARRCSDHGLLGVRSPVGRAADRLGAPVGVIAVS